MTQYEPISIVPGWFQFNYVTKISRSETILNSVPSSSMIMQLVFLPLAGSPDPYHLEKYRVPQNNVIESQLLVQKYSNELVMDLSSIYSDPSTKAMPDKPFFRGFCGKNNINYDLLEYFMATIHYCDQILPIPIDYEGMYSRIHEMSGIKKDEEAGHFVRKPWLSKRYVVYDHKEQKRKAYLSNRFVEYRIASRIVDSFSQEISFNVDSDHSLISSELFDETIRLVKEMRKQKKQAKSFEVFLSQCWFCYGFFERQTAKNGKVSRYCTRPECKKKNDAWRIHLDRIGITMESLGL